MFSTSITASSTTTPSATTRPPRLIVLSDRPQLVRIQMVASSDTGMELKDTNAPRQSRNVTQQQHHDQHRADQQRIAQFRDRALDETRRPSSARMILHPAQRQFRRQGLEPLLQIVRDFERVGAVLRGGLDQDAQARRR